MNFYNCIRIGTNCLQRQIVRDYAFKSDLKIKWVRPEKVSCIKPEKSGDGSKLPPVDLNSYIPGFQHSKELEEADSTIQSLFQIKNNPNVHTSNLYRENMIKELQRHPLDYGSMEAKLAKMTATIRRFQEHMEKFPRDRRIKVILKEMIDKRKKYLKFLRRWDYRRFEWVLEKLDLIYKPPPAEFHWITRKESLQKLTDLYCENLKQERLDAYRKKLEAQMIPFLEEKIKSLEFIRKEQIELEVPVTVTAEEIEATKKHLEELKEKRAEADAAEKKKEETEIH